MVNVAVNEPFDLGSGSPQLTFLGDAPRVTQREVEGLVAVLLQKDPVLQELPS